MIFKDVKNIKKDTTELKEKVNKTEEILSALGKGAMEKSRKYDETLNYLKNIKIDVKNIDIVFNENATYGVKIEYDIKPVILMIDSTTNETITDQRMKAMNMLNLISYQDMSKISKAIKECKVKNKQFIEK